MRGPKSNKQVIFYIPNIIDYFRLVCLILGCLYIDTTPLIFLSFYLIQVFLDFFDGYFARLYNQTSDLGAWLDVVIDNLGRGILWTHIHPLGYLISTVEWLAFSFTQKYGAKWKYMFENSPWLIRNIFKNNFRTPLGLTVVTAGLQSLPILLYTYQHFSIYMSSLLLSSIEYLIIYCAIGRFLCLLAESWVILKGLEELIEPTSP